MIISKFCDALLSDWTAKILIVDTKSLRVSCPDPFPEIKGIGPQGYSQQ